MIISLLIRKSSLEFPDRLTSQALHWQIADVSVQSIVFNLLGVSSEFPLRTFAYKTLQCYSSLHFHFFSKFLLLKYLFTQRGNGNSNLQYWPYWVALFPCGGDLSSAMPVDVNHWRAAIASFHFPIITKPNTLDQVQPFSSVFLVIFKLCLFCCMFFAIPIPVLLFTMVVQTAANFSIYANTCFLHVFAIFHSHAKAVLYILFELIKHFPVLFLHSCNRCTLKCLVFR